MGFSTKECAWKHVEIKFLGRTIIGLRGFEVNLDVDDEYLYGAGADPIDIQSGNNAYPCSLKLLKYEIDMMNDAAVAAGFVNISQVPHDANVITVSFKKNATDTPRTLTAFGVKVGSQKFALDQGGKMTEISLPCLAMKVVIK